MFNRLRFTALLVVLAILLGAAATNAAESPQPTSQKNKLSSSLSCRLPISEFLKQEPDSIVLYHGSAKVVAAQYSTEPQKECPAAQLINPVPSLLPFDSAFEPVLNGETIYDFLAVRAGIEPGFDGFHLYRTTNPAIEKLNRFLKNSSKVGSYKGRDIYAVDTGYGENWYDFMMKALSSRVYFCAVSDNTFVAATSLGYFDPMLKAPSFKRDSLALKCTEFFERAKRESFCAECVFTSKYKNSNPDISQLISRLSYLRDGNLSTNPYSFSVWTRKDDVQCVKPILAYFNNRGKAEKESQSRFRITIQSDPDFFYSKLHYLLSSGILMNED
ncbi:MAG: hypothetical protein R3F51_17255 [Cyanobacteriota/Melainabacteria group bacterium]